MRSNFCCYVNNTSARATPSEVYMSTKSGSLRDHPTSTRTSADANAFCLLAGLGIGLDRTGRPAGAVLGVVVIFDRRGDTCEDVELFRGEYVCEAVADALDPGRPGRLERGMAR